MRNRKLFRSRNISVKAPQVLFGLYFMGVILSHLFPQFAWADSKVIWADSLTAKIYRTSSTGNITLASNVDLPVDIAPANTCNAYLAERGASSIEKFRIDEPGSGLEHIRTTGSTLTSIAQNGHLYWTEYLLISKGLLGTDTSHDLVLLDHFTGITQPNSITVDLVGQKIYWLDSGNGKVLGYNRLKRADLDGNNRIDILNGLTSVSDIAIDFQNSKIYWADNSHPPAIRKSDLDGTNTGILTSAGILYTRQLALGEDGLYALDLSGVIRRISLDGNTITTVVSGIELGSALAVVNDADSDGDLDCDDQCPADANKHAPGVCGCNVADIDSDADGTANCLDGCMSDPHKITAGICGCGTSDIDSDADGTMDCQDSCSTDPLKIIPGICGCGVLDTDTDNDSTQNCLDGCPSDPNKISAGICGCGLSDADSDADGAVNCQDQCSSDPLKVSPGVCGCGIPDLDTDSDGTLNCNDSCPNDSTKTSAGICGCGLSDADSDADGAVNCQDQCSSDPLKVTPGVCGCGIPDLDTDSDGTLNCNDSCPNDSTKTSAGICGCGQADSDSDNDGTANCVDLCPSDSEKSHPGACGCNLFEVPDLKGKVTCSKTRGVVNNEIPEDPDFGAAKRCAMQVSLDEYVPVKGSKVEYRIFLYKGTSNKPLSKFISAKRKSSIEFPKFGQYRIRYQVVLLKGNKIIRQTALSDEETLTIEKSACKPK